MMGPCTHPAKLTSNCLILSIWVAWKWACVTWHFPRRYHVGVWQAKTVRCLRIMPKRMSIPNGLVSFRPAIPNVTPNVFTLQNQVYRTANDVLRHYVTTNVCCLSHRTLSPHDVWEESDQRHTPAQRDIGKHTRAHMGQHTIAWHALLWSKPQRAVGKEISDDR